VLIQRNGEAPRVHSSARIAPSATIVGNVVIGARGYVDHAAVIASGGPPVEIGGEVIVFPGEIIRSVGGTSRPAFGVRIGERTLVSPLCADRLHGRRQPLSGYRGDPASGRDARRRRARRCRRDRPRHDRCAGAARVGMRHVAVPTAEGFLSTPDVERARAAVTAIDFFETAFGADADDQADLHAQVMATLLDEVHAWRDEPLDQPERERP
jgi:hypothetical protein